MDEEIDIVDADNKVLYVTTKRQAHEQGLLHRTVISEVFDSRGRWLLIKQAADRQDAGQYVSPIGGHARAGETEDDALKREALEETGLQNFAYRLKGRVVYSREVLGRKENHYFVLYEIQSDEPLVLNHESVSYRALTEAQLKRELRQYPERFGAAFIRVLEEFYPHLLA